MIAIIGITLMAFKFHPYPGSKNRWLHAMADVLAEGEVSLKIAMVK